MQVKSRLKLSTLTLLSCSMVISVYTPSAQCKIFSIKNPIRKTVKITKQATLPTLYTTLGIVALGKCVASITTLITFMKFLKDAKQSYVKNPMLKLTKYLMRNLSDAPDIDKYVIPGIVVLLTGNAICSLYVSVSMFKRVYKKIKRKKDTRQVEEKDYENK